MLVLEQGVLKNTLLRFKYIQERFRKVKILKTMKIWAFKQIKEAQTSR